MAFWFALLWWIGTSIVSALLAKPQVENARPSGLDDFQVPTATEGRPVPIIVGKVKMAGPNVAWYGDLQAVALKEKVGGFFGIGAKSVTKAFEYNIGVQLVISSGPIDGYDRIWMGDKEIHTGETSGNSSFTDRELFGGEDSGGGIEFTLQFFNGADDQAESTYLQSQLALTPRYQNVAYMILNDGGTGPGYIGNTATLRNISFEPFWYPNSLGVTGGKERIGDDANPICFLFELLTTNTDWGVRMPVSDILLTGTVAEGALIPVAEQVADELLGFSMVIDGAQPASQIINEIMRHVDGKFRLDLADGKFKVALARPETGSVPLLDESNIIKLSDFSRPTWADTFNQVRVSYSDRAKEYDRTSAIDQDLANLDILGGRERIHAMSFPGVKTAQTAGILAAREMFSLGSPSARCKVEVEGSQYALFVGQAVEFTWVGHEISELPMRITRIKYGRDIGASMTLDLVEDAFRLEPPGFTDPPPTDWVAPIVDPVNLRDSRIWLPPNQLQAAVTTPPALVVLAARDGGLQLEYDVWVDFNGGGETGDMVLTNPGQDSFNPIADLNGAIFSDLDGPPHYVSSLTIDNIFDITPFTIVDNASTTLGGQLFNLILIDDELMYYEAAVDNLNGSVTLNTVNRGVLGTIPADHADNARVWFPTFGGALLIQDTSTVGLAGDIRVRVTPRTAIGTLDIAVADNIPEFVDFSVAGTTAYAPGDPQVNGELFIDQDWTRTSATLRVTWKNRNRNSQAFDTKQDDPVPLNGIAFQTFVRAFVKRVDTDATVASTTDAIAGTFNATNFLEVTVPGEVLDQGGVLGPGGTIAELDHYIIVNAAGLSVGVSQQWQTPDFEVFGFGLGFGEEFGGQAEAADPNTGFILDQGAAPIVIPPTPASEITNRIYRLTIRNDPVTSGLPGVIGGDEETQWTLKGFDATQQLNYQIGNVLQGADFPTEAAVAQKVFDDINAQILASSLSFTATFDVPTSTIELRGTQGSTMRFEGRVQRPPSSGRVLIYTPPAIVEEAFGATAGVLGAYYLDFIQLSVDPATGITIETLAPSLSNTYQTQNVQQAGVNFQALTRAGQRLIDQIEVIPFSGVSAGQRGASFAFFINNPAPASDAYDAQFSKIVGILQDSPVSHLFQIFIGTIPGGTQTRTAIAIQPVQDIKMTATHHSGNQLTPFRLVVNDSIMAEKEGPIAQTTAFGYSSDTSPFGGPMESQVLQAVINGEEFSSGVAAPGSSVQVTDAAQNVVDDINASAQPVTAAREPIHPQFPNRFVVTHNTPGLTGVFDAQIWLGVGDHRFEFRIIDE